MKRFKAYVICTSPRSGSTLLCRLLRDTGIAGHPGSHFHKPSLSRWLEYYDLAPDARATQEDALKAVFAAAYAYGKGETDLFGLRLQRHSFDFFMQQLRSLHPSNSNDESRVEAAFGKTLFVHLTRENKLDQAISYVKAKQSGLWHMAPDGTELERLSEPKEPVYDAKAIAAQLNLSRKMDNEWANWFRTEGIEPLRVTYDDLSSDPHATLARILVALNLNAAPFANIPVPTAKLADATNQEWAARFRAETENR